MADKNGEICVVAFELLVAVSVDNGKVIVIVFLTESRRDSDKRCGFYF